MESKLSCDCGGKMLPHQIGVLGCKRDLVEKPPIKVGTMWNVDGHLVTDYALNNTLKCTHHHGAWWSKPKKDEGIPPCELCNQQMDYHEEDGDHCPEDYFECPECGFNIYVSEAIRVGIYKPTKKGG